MIMYGPALPLAIPRSVISNLGRVTSTKPLTFVGSCDRLRLRGSGSLGRYSLVSCHHDIIENVGEEIGSLLR